MCKKEKQLKLTEKQTETINKLGVFDPLDMLNYYPSRYQEITSKPYLDFEINDFVIFKGLITSKVTTFRSGFNKSMTRFNVRYDDHNIQVIIFNMPWTKGLKENVEVIIKGQFNKDRNIILKSYSFNDDDLKDEINVIYPLKEKITNKAVNAIIKKVYLHQINSLHDDIPNIYLEKYRLLNRKDALRCLHFPRNIQETKLAIRTLKYEEFLKFSIALLLHKNQMIYEGEVSGKFFDNQRIEQFIKSLPFTLTEDQISCTNDIINDLKADKVMYRLVQGDVGSGKTIVAAIALYATYLAKMQSAFMAPTEILAIQHYQTLKSLFNDEINIVLLTGKTSKKDRDIISKDLREGKIDIIVGTHTLFQDSVNYHELGLVITDEQHRFGTNQRRKIKEKGHKVDFLLMSATPIPRTLASTLYADMDISNIKSMPNNRLKPITEIINNNSITSISEHIFKELKAKRQIYIVCNSIDNSTNSKNVIDIYNHLVEYFKDYKVGLLHGKLNADLKEEVMHDFSENKINILVSTVVIEVGVNVVNASTMIIYDAHRFGLSQLHQLRGRVLRGANQGYCYLLTTKDKEENERLKVLVETSDGFKIAQEDLMIRGPGDILGNRQSGLPSLILGNLITDTKIIEASKEDALEILNNQDISENINLINKLKNLNQNNLSHVD